MLNLEKIWHETLQIRPPHLSDVDTLPWEIQKSHFSTLLFIYFRVAQKKTSSNCSSAALAVYLLLFSTSSYLHSPSTALGHATGGACALIWACWGSRQRLVAMWAEFQHSMVYYVTEQCQKDWNHVLMQNVITLNTCCDIACLTTQLPHITTGSFQIPDEKPTTSSFQSLKRLK